MSKSSLHKLASVASPRAVDHLNSQWPPGASHQTFSANLRALSEVQPDLALRLCWSALGDHVSEGADGEVFYSRRGAWIPLAVPAGSVDPAIQGALARVGDDAKILVFGVGLGELVESLLTESNSRLVVWDRDPWMLRMLLGRRDYFEPIQSGRLQLALGADLLELVSDPTIEARVEHPLFTKIYAHELDWLESGAREKRAVLCDGKLYVDSLARALKHEGFSIWTMDFERLSVEELDYTVSALQPELLAAINVRDGFVEFTHRHGIELMTWEIDPFTHQVSAPTTPSGHAHLFSYRKVQVSELCALGYQNAEYLPLAADTELRRPVSLTNSERERYAAPVSFVGSSMLANAQLFIQQVLADLSGWVSETSSELDPQAVLEQLVTAQRSAPDEWVTPELLERFAPGFVDWSHRTIGKRDPALLIGEFSAAERRLSYVANLAEFGMRVWGDEGWRSIAASGVNYCGPATHEHDVTRVYGASQINLDIGRLYQNDIVTMRVFDILACGGFALVEHTEALEELFEVGVELESYRDLAECREKLKHYLAAPEEARAIAERGAEAVRERHAFQKRVRHMLSARKASGSFGLAS